jgi:hypothetical protein
LINEYDQRYYHPIVEQLKKEDDLEQAELTRKCEDEKARIRVKNNLDGSSFADIIIQATVWTGVILIFGFWITLSMKSVPAIFKYLQIPLGLVLMVMGEGMEAERRKELYELYNPARLEYDRAIKDHKITYQNLYESLRKQRDGNHKIINQILEQEVQDAVEKNNIPVPNKVWAKISSHLN